MVRTSRTLCMGLAIALAATGLNTRDYECDALKLGVVDGKGKHVRQRGVNAFPFFKRLHQNGAYFFGLAGTGALVKIPRGEAAPTYETNPFLSMPLTYYKGQGMTETIERRRKGGYKINHKLGMGSFSTVYSVNKDGARDYAIKVTKISGDRSYQKSYAAVEMDINDRISKALPTDRSNVPFLKIHETFQDDMNMYLVMDLCESPALLKDNELYEILTSFGLLREDHNLLSMFGQKRAEELVQVMAGRMVDGLSIMHSQNLAWMDMKMENILICKPADNELTEDLKVALNSVSSVGQLTDAQKFEYLKVLFRNAKLIDFNLAMESSDTDTYTKMKGTPEYFSPQMVSSCARTFEVLPDGVKDTKIFEYNPKKTDVYILGVMLYELYFGVPPKSGSVLKFLDAAGENPPNVRKMKVYTNQWKSAIPTLDFFTPRPSDYSQDFASLLDGCLNMAEHKRPTMNQLVRSPFVKKELVIFHKLPSRIEAKAVLDKKGNTSTTNKTKSPCNRAGADVHISPVQTKALKKFQALTLRNGNVTADRVTDAADKENKWIPEHTGNPIILAAKNGKPGAFKEYDPNTYTDGGRIEAAKRLRDALGVVQPMSVNRTEMSATI